MKVMFMSDKYSMCSFSPLDASGLVKASVNKLIELHHLTDCSIVKKELECCYQFHREPPKLVGLLLL